MRQVILLLSFTTLLISWLIRPSSPLGANHSLLPSGPNHLPSPPRGVATAVDYFKAEAPIFSQKCTDLATTIKKLDLHSNSSIADARHKLAECRASWKRIESFMEYFFRSSSRIYNRAPKFEAEEPGMEYQSPLGLQVIETLLYEPNTPGRKRQLLEQSAAVASSAADLLALLYDFHAGDKQILESLHLQLLRVITLGITGYDAPYLKTGISESYQSLISIKHQLEPYNPDDTLRYYLDSAIAYCKTHGNFDSFDRLTFLKYLTLPLQRRLSSMLNHSARDIFSPGALNTPVPTDTTLVAAGRQLFFDRSLSGNGQRSCATCHDPEKKFTDGLTTPIAFDGHSTLDRNAPSLLYSGFQYRQFWDGRVETLENQVATVLKDPKEMHSSRSGDTSIAKAIAAYIRTLHPMSSAFDHYIEGGPDSLLTASQMRGANLFMGRAQCATCHFIPLFNGLIPPDYTLTEFEVLGTTRTDRLDKPRLSKDAGRYNVYPFPFYKGAFKTPTVRNTAVTAPYMHNGAFRTLAKVVEFYDRGGGQGLGLNIPSQTLSSHPLGLTPKEKRDIIQFLYTLTDTP